MYWNTAKEQDTPNELYPVLSLTLATWFEDTGKTVKISDCFWSLGPNRSPNRNGANQNKKIILKVLPVAPIKAEKIISNDK